ncbi:MAG: GNAT family N-acetyltransferase [Deltaproteobacteria bacterium]|nr:GNAT family N-acetyltransferase [Deltaproteobacteria bacterium]
MSQSFVSLTKKCCGTIIRRVQGTGKYRLIAKNLRPSIQLIDFCQRAKIKIPRALNLGDQLAETSSIPGVTNYLALRKNTVVGFVQLVRHPPEHFPYVGYWLFGLTVSTPWRGMGIGEALTLKVMQQAEAEGASELLLLVAEDNWPALKLYDKLGFEKTVIPALESQLEEERLVRGKRRLVMRTALPGS